MTNYYYEWIGFIFSCCLSARLLATLTRTIWMYWAASAIGFGYQWRTETGSWAIVTGSTDGIGLEYARAMASKGYNLLLISRTASKLEATEDMIRTEFVECKDVRTLVADFSSLDIYDNVKDAINQLPGDIAVLINNVGIAYNTYEYFGDLDATHSKYFDETIINVNIVSCTKMTQLVLPIMERQATGLIMNVSSVSATTPVPMLALYAATKTFVDTFSQALSLECTSNGVLVQSVLPGYVATKMSKMAPSWLVPTAEDYVRASLRTIGHGNRTYGHWVHALMANNISIFFAAAGERLYGKFTVELLAHFNRRYMTKVHTVNNNLKVN
ncbi:Very-long-chain 3-oxoacyl-CoA reductase [Halotydeus destructor]|nr:Very-long-chain 3-oxoacyl-CoA reductase [Halotydeus destructor]